MIVGAIETADADHISGWMYSAAEDLRDKLILAFLDGQCVGSGRIGLYRDDLSSAGLSHGCFGYHFKILVPKPHDAKRVIVSLEGCEAVILPAGARVTSMSEPRPPASYLGGDLVDPARIAWLRQRHMVPEPTLDMLEVLAGFAVASQALNDGEDPEEVSRQIFEAVMLRSVHVGVLELSASNKFMADLLSREEVADAGMFILGCDRRVTLNAVEFGEFDLAAAQDADMDDSAGGIDYVLDQKRLLVIRRWTRSTFRRMVGERLVKVYYPTVHPPTDHLTLNKRKIEA